MAGIREIAQAEQTDSLRDLTSRYGVTSVRQLQAAFNQRTEVTYFSQKIVRTDTGIRIMSEDGKTTSVEIPADNITPDQKNQALDKFWDSVKEYLRKNKDDILNGRIKAADIGGAVFGIAGSVIAMIFAPFAGAGMLSKILNLAFSGAAAQEGRYYGAAVDDLVSLLKGESDLTVRDIVGTLATVIIVADFAPVAVLGGTDAWSLTKEIGKALGGDVSDAVHKIENAVGAAVNPPVNAAGGVLDFIRDIVGL